MSVDMVASPTWRLRCDGMDRQRCGQTLHTEAPHKTAAVAYATSRWGWKTVKGRLLCPKHQT